MPTKVPSYLISDSPILVYGPPGVAQVEYAREKEWGYVVDRRDCNDLREAIIKLVTDEKLRKSLTTKSFDVATRYHNASIVRHAFQTSLSQAAE